MNNLIIYFITKTYENYLAESNENTAITFEVILDGTIITVVLG